MLGVQLESDVLPEEAVVVAEYLDENRMLHAVIGYQVEAAFEWVLAWDDTGPNGWSEGFDDASLAFARLGQLIDLVTSHGDGDLEPVAAFVQRWARFTDVRSRY